ncbi:MAG: AMP-dependent synthetase and ligase [Frankiales bacterium]|nr:AMP-dependent synthetase and ligase [Frankiales bacterium]
MRALLPGVPTLATLAAALDGTGPALLTSDEPRVLEALGTGPVDDDVAVVVPTSGSTGAPKGVLLTAAALLASAAAALERLGGPGRWLLAVPPTRVGGLQVLVRSLVAGLDPVVLPPGPFTASSLDGVVGCRYASLVPTQLGRLPDGALDGFDAVLLGGAAAPAPLLARFPPVVTTYGMSETSGGCVYDGVPLPGVEVEAGARVRLRGPVLAKGYRDGAPLVDPDGWFTTGDVGTLVDGRLVVHGRADDVINTGGQKVAPAAVEEVLLAHPGVREVAVVGVPDPEWGQRVVAHVVGTLSLADARDWVGERLDRAHAPRELVQHASLPLLTGGKVDRRALQGG